MVFELPSFSTDRRSAEALIRTLHPHWHVNADGRVFCPECKQLALASMKAQQAPQNAGCAK